MTETIPAGTMDLDSVRRELLATTVVALPFGLLLYALAWSETVLAAPFGFVLISLSAPWDGEVVFVRIWLASVWMVWPLAWFVTRAVQRAEAGISRRAGQAAPMLWLWRRRLAPWPSLGLALAGWMTLFLTNLYLPWRP